MSLTKVFSEVDKHDELVILRIPVAINLKRSVNLNQYLFSLVNVLPEPLTLSSMKISENVPIVHDTFALLIYLENCP